MAEWRVTFPQSYLVPSGKKPGGPLKVHPDYVNPKNRQGFYVNAGTKEEAEAKVEARFPKGGKAEAVFSNRVDHPEDGTPIKGT